MRKLLPILTVVLLGITLPGCAWVKRHTPWHHHAKPAPPPATNAPSTVLYQPAPRTNKPASTVTTSIVTPDNSLSATVLSVNTIGRFVVLNFPQGQMPKLDQHMFLYRSGLKSAEVKIVGPQQDTSIVADIISGDARAGDTVRDQ